MDCHDLQDLYDFPLPPVLLLHLCIDSVNFLYSPVHPFRGSATPRRPRIALEYLFPGCSGVTCISEDWGGILHQRLQNRHLVDQGEVRGGELSMLEVPHADPRFLLGLLHLQ